MREAFNLAIGGAPRRVNSRGATQAPAPTAMEPLDAAPASMVRLERLLSALQKKEALLPVEEVASLGVLLLDALEGSRGEHLRNANPFSLLLTRAGTIRVLGPSQRTGPLRWLTPEGVEGRPLTERSDVFSVCSVLFAAATTRAPFAASSELSTLVAIRDGTTVGTVETLRPDLPASFAQVVHRGLEAVPERRHESLKALRAALEPWTGVLEVAREAFLQRAFELVPLRTVTPPPPSDDAGMLEAIARGDESSRLVYADLLEERGLGPHARWLRLESRVQTMTTGPERNAALNELRDLRQLVGREFLATIARPALEGCPVRFGFRCPMTWAELTPTSDPVVRHCSGCDSPVTFFDTLREAQEAAALGQCVAIDLSVERHEGDLEAIRGGFMGQLS